MGTVANLYDSGPISPVARINDNIAVFTEAKYVPYRIKYIEGIPASSPFLVDMCVVANAGLPIPANGQIAKSVVAVLQMNLLELLHLRWYPIDDVEGGLWQLSNMARFAPRGGQARVSLFTAEFDPWLATATFYIIGRDKDINIGVWNPQAVAQPTARFQFLGYRYILEGPLPDEALRLPITFLPAQGL